MKIQVKIMKQLLVILGINVATLQSSSIATTGNIHLELHTYYAVFYDIGWFLGYVLEEVLE